MHADNTGITFLQNTKNKQNVFPNFDYTTNIFFYVVLQNTSQSDSSSYFMDLDSKMKPSIISGTCNCILLKTSFKKLAFDNKYYGIAIK